MSKKFIKIVLLLFPMLLVSCQSNSPSSAETKSSLTISSSEANSSKNSSNSLEKPSTSSKSSSSVNPSSSSLKSSSSVNPSSNSSKNSSTSSALPVHVHKFENRQLQEFYAYGPTCDVPLTYFKSCECGQMSTQTFEVGTPNTHNFVKSNKFSGEECSLCHKPKLINCNASFYGETKCISITDFAKVIGNDIIVMIFGANSIIEVQRTTFYYNSVDQNNNPIVLSGAITVPITMDMTTFSYVPKIKGIDINHHPTFVSNNDAPSNKITEFSALVAAGYVVIECDLLGYGVTGDSIPTYHCQHLVPINIKDGVLSAFDLLKEKYNFERTNEPIINTGYSEGGYVAMSFLKYLENDASPEIKEKIPLTKSYCGSGAYNIQTFVSSNLAKEYTQSPEFLMLGVMNCITYHNDLFADLTMDDFFTDYGKNMYKYLRCKDLLGLTNYKLKLSDNLQIRPGEIFSSEFLNTASKQYRSMIDACNKENLLDGSWSPKSNIVIYYSKTDEIIPLECANTAINQFKNLSNFSSEELKGLHEECGALFYTDIITKLVIS